MRKLGVGIQNIKTVINNFIYIDKTQLIYELVSTEDGAYFLSRPRRFGKSLLINTFYEIFSGNKELLKDLWIGKNTNYDFENYPIVKFVFNNIDRFSIDEFKESLILQINSLAHDNGITIYL